MGIIILLLVLALQPRWAPAREPPGPSDYINTAKMNLAALEQELFSDINRTRTAQGLSAYRFSQRLWYRAKNHSRRMALDQKVEPINLDAVAEARAGSNPASFWAGMSGSVGRAAHAAPLAEIINRWANDQEARSALLSHRYDQAAVGVSADRRGFLYVTLISADEVYPENNIQRLEQAAFAAVNRLRAERGLQPLRSSDPLRQIGREHSRTMALRRYLSHKDLNGRGVAERLRRHGINNWQACAENIASNQGHRDPARTAVDSWRTSPSHAAAMLRPDFTHMGIGVAKALDETYYFTQIFAKAP